MDGHRDFYADWNMSESEGRNRIVSLIMLYKKYKRQYNRDNRDEV